MHNMHSGDGVARCCGRKQTAKKTPGGCRLAHALARVVVQRELGESGGRAGQPVGSGPTPIPAAHCGGPLLSPRPLSGGLGTRT